MLPATFLLLIHPTTSLCYGPTTRPAGLCCFLFRERGKVGLRVEPVILDDMTDGLDCSAPSLWLPHSDGLADELIPVVHARNFQHAEDEVTGIVDVHAVMRPILRKIESPSAKSLVATIPVVQMQPRRKQTVISLRQRNRLDNCVTNLHFVHRVSSHSSATARPTTHSLGGPYCPTCIPSSSQLVPIFTDTPIDSPSGVNALLS